ncbi:MAG: hypothetical protein ABFS56_13875 [Pseudomonadota bacterium]
MPAGGSASVDQHLLTGESQPVEKESGDKVFAATLLLSGRIAIDVQTAGNDTVAAQIGEILNKTQHYKDNLMARGQKIANQLAPVTLGIGHCDMGNAGRDTRPFCFMVRVRHQHDGFRSPKRLNLPTNPFQSRHLSQRRTNFRIPTPSRYHRIRHPPAT